MCKGRDVRSVGFRDDAARGRGSWRTAARSDRTLRFVTSLAYLALASGTGCSRGRATREDSKPAALVDPATQEPGAPPPSPDTQKAVQVQASSPEMEKIAQELAR